jgi:hypothetical protein
MMALLAWLDGWPMISFSFEAVGPDFSVWTVGITENIKKA